MLTYPRLLWIHLRLGVLNELQYRANLVVQVVQSAVGLATALLGLGVVFSKTDTLAGWRPDELLAIVGVYFLVGGLARLVVQPSLSRFMEDVRLGTLDFTLTKPVDAQVLVSVRQVEVWKLIDVLIGVAVLGVALARLGAAIGPAESAAFAITLAAGLTIIYSFLLILATCVFWFIRLDNILNIFQSMYEAGRWPIDVYPPWLQASLTLSSRSASPSPCRPGGWSAASPRKPWSGRCCWRSPCPWWPAGSGRSASATTPAPRPDPGRLLTISEDAGV